MKTIYLNMRSSYGVETVDELTREDFPTRKEFLKELKNMVINYHMAGMGVYTSRRCTNDWKQK